MRGGKNNPKNSTLKVTNSILSTQAEILTLTGKIVMLKPFKAVIDDRGDPFSLKKELGNLRVTVAIKEDVILGHLR
ncbi:hypothetical protein TSUD_242710 [Trifolium subterraneum]|uniref:Uncharacterized protein n=1 Tax=Trifolium subterraneum TaxID=3900 RepID=A0A2Z6MRS0_TRISU|nr:hypothetical protein TSUD_242710 [Trifolium subterraneum]